MVKHYIIMSSSYTDGARVALDITEASQLNSDAIAKIIREIKQSCGDDVPLSTHLIETGTESWESVVKYDLFLRASSAFRRCQIFRRKSKKTGC